VKGRITKEDVMAFLEKGKKETKKEVAAPEKKVKKGVVAESKMEYETVKMKDF